MDSQATRRLQVKDLDVKRVVGAFRRRVTTAFHEIRWHLSPKSRENTERLNALKDLYRGETLFLIANGPSIAKTDVGLLAGVKTMSMNRAYLSWEDWGFTPTFFVAVNELVLRQFSEDIDLLDTQCFLDFRCRYHFRDFPGRRIFIRTRNSFSDKFRSPTGAIDSGGTVTFVALQLAFFMGFDRVVLLGLDHKFASATRPNETEARANVPDTDHFRPDYFPPGVLWQGPDLQRSEIAYRVALKAYERAGREIVDATVDGHCPVFPRVTLAQVLEK